MPRIVTRSAQIIAAIVVLAIAVAAGLFWHLNVNGVTITVSESELQAELQKLFPVEKEYPGGIHLEFFDPQLELVEGSNRIDYAIDATVDLTALDRQFTGRAQISGVPHFDADTNEFFVQDSRVENIEIDGLPALLTPPVRMAADIIARDHLNRTAVYQLEGPIQGEGLLASMPELKLLDVTVEDQQLRLRLGL